MSKNQKPAELQGYEMPPVRDFLNETQRDGTTLCATDVYSETYGNLITKLTDAKLALVDGGVKSYTVDDRSLTRFDIDKLSKEIDEAVNKRAEYAAIMNGKKPRRAVGVIPRDF